MTTQAISPAARSASSEIDTSARAPLLLLLGSAICWLIISGLFSIVTTVQLHTPTILADCPFLTYGRMQAVQETVFVYGWAANAAFAVALWLVSRLGGVPLRGLGLLTVGTLFWNLGVTGGIVFILAGEATSVPFLQMPAYIHPLLLVAYAAIATPGILAWIDRRVETTFAAQWYAVGALFLFPWLYSAAQVMLLSAPVHGVAQAVVANWFGQNLVTCWLILTALAAAYYLVPKLTGRVIPHYDFALHGFWVLVFFGSVTGARHLVGGPVPAWIPTLAIVCTCLLLFHYLIVVLNLRYGFGAQTNAALRFVSLGLLFYVIGGVFDAIFSFQMLAATVQYTFFPMAQLKLALAGAFSFLIFGAIYHLVPRISGSAWPSDRMVRGHFAASLLGTLVTVVCLAGAGWTQGKALLDPAISFSAISVSTKPWLVAATAGEALLFMGSLMFALNFFRLTASAYLGSALFGTASTMEASAS